MLAASRARDGQPLAGALCPGQLAAHHAALRAGRARARRWPRASPRRPPRWWRAIVVSHVRNGRRSPCRPSTTCAQSLPPVTTTLAARYATIRVAHSVGRDLATPAAHLRHVALRDGGACSPHPMSATGVVDES